jgi:hypothetical protein
VEVIIMKGILTAVVVFIACGIAGCATPMTWHDEREGSVSSDEVEEVDFCTENPWSTDCILKATYRT